MQKNVSKKLWPTFESGGTESIRQKNLDLCDMQVLRCFIHFLRRQSLYLNLTVHRVERLVRVVVNFNFLQSTRALAAVQ